MHPLLLPFKDSWAKDVVAQIDADKDRLKIRELYTRVPKASTEDSLFARTLNSSATIRNAVSVWDPSSRAHGELTWLLEIGDGLNGHPKIVHGGLTAVIMDEVLWAAHFNATKLSGFTANLSVDYRAPMPADSTLLARAWLEKVDGRKRWLKGTIQGPDGVVYGEATALFLLLKSAKL